MLSELGRCARLQVQEHEERDIWTNLACWISGQDRDLKKVWDFSHCPCPRKMFDIWRDGTVAASEFSWSCHSLMEIPQVTRLEHSLTPEHSRNLIDAQSEALPCRMILRFYYLLCS